MKKESEPGTGSVAPACRCAIYTRKSTEEGLNQPFNTLEAQREAAEAYILSQRHLGWSVVADRYDDGGYTGGNLERPALQKLLTDLKAGKIDCVVIYKVEPLEPVITRLCTADGDLRATWGQLSIGHSAAEHDQLFGTINFKYSVVVCAVRARAHRRPHERQNVSGEAERQVGRRHPGAGVRRCRGRRQTNGQP